MLRLILTISFVLFWLYHIADTIWFGSHFEAFGKELKKIARSPFTLDMGDWICQMGAILSVIFLSDKIRLPKFMYNFKMYLSIVILMVVCLFLFFWSFQERNSVSLALENLIDNFPGDKFGIQSDPACLKLNRQLIRYNWLHWVSMQLLWACIFLSSLINKTRRIADPVP
jgi:hypothetical protein